MSGTGISENQGGILRVLQSKNEIRAFYNKISKFYDLLAEKSEEPVRRLGLHRLNAQPGEIVLEVGFGTGHCLEQIARSVHEAGQVYGIDLSDQMLKVAEVNLHQSGLAGRVELVCGDAAHLPYRSESIDAVFMSFTLELFDTPEIPVVLAECRRVLRPGGRIVVVGMSKAGQDGPMVHLFEWTHQHFPNYLDCRPIFVSRSLQDAGFSIVGSDTEMMWIPVEIICGIKRDTAQPKSE
jgi:demethylmenaquinone methyltransferase/2-methoxy-6-polyprenyl-1,4-benzoquinol methylase